MLLIIKRCYEELLSWPRRNASAIFIVAAIGLVAHFTLYSGSLTNPDGLWSGMGYDSFMARGWDYSLGRWAWYLVTKLRGGVCTPGLMAPIVMLGFAAGGAIAADALRVERPALRVAVGAVVVCSPLVACMLTYYPYADVYSLAFLFSAFAIACQRFEFVKAPVRVGLSALAVCVSVGFYQTTIGVSCALLLMALAADVLFDGPDGARPAFVRFATGVLGILVGCVLYIVVMKAAQAHVGVSMANYRGAGSISLSHALAMLPTSVPGAYKQFFAVLFDHNVFGNRFLARAIVAGLGCLGVLSAVLGCLRSRRLLPICTFAVCVALLPMAALAICVIAPDSGSLMPLMVGGVLVVLYFPAALASAAARAEGAGASIVLGPTSGTPALTFDPQITLEVAGLSDDARSGGENVATCVTPRRAIPRVLGSLVLLATCCLAWSYTLQVNYDSAVQYKIDNQCTNVATQIVSDINDYEGYTSSMKVAIVGLPTDGSYQLPAEAWNASPYVRWTLFWRTYAGNEGCWSQLLKIKCGMSYNFADTAEVETIAKTDEFKQMPDYPGADSIRVINGVLVVKVSDASNFC